MDDVDVVGVVDGCDDDFVWFGFGDEFVVVGGKVERDWGVVEGGELGEGVVEVGLVCVVEVDDVWGGWVGCCDGWVEEVGVVVGVDEGIVFFGLCCYGCGLFCSVGELLLVKWLL